MLYIQNHINITPLEFCFTEMCAINPITARELPAVMRSRNRDTVVTINAPIGPHYGPLRRFKPQIRGWAQRREQTLVAVATGRTPRWSSHDWGRQGRETRLRVCRRPGWSDPDVGRRGRRNQGCCGRGTPVACLSDCHLQERRVQDTPGSRSGWG